MGPIWRYSISAPMIPARVGRLQPLILCRLKNDQMAQAGRKEAREQRGVFATPIRKFFNIY